jgi:transmembrane sensor
METPADSDRIAAEAADWFLRFHCASPRHPDQQVFSEWLTRSPTHIEEYLAVSSAWIALNVPDEGAFTTDALIAAARESREADNIVHLRDRPGNPPADAPPRRASFTRSISRRVLTAVAACLTAVLIAWIGSVRRPDTAIETAVGEQRSVTLRDGSVVFLNTNSRVRIQWLGSERHIDLTRGEARFQVTRDAAHPFIVVTSKAAVRVLGTVFNVRADAQSTQVAVMEGQVEVMATVPASQTPQPGRPASRVNENTDDAVPSIRLGAGQRAAVTSRGIVPNEGPSIESVAAWTQRRLIFHDESLSTVVREFNRYRTLPLVVDDAQLAALRISGAFDLNDPESLLAYLETFETVRVERSGDGSEHLLRGPAE